MTGREGETFPGFFHDREERPDTGPCGSRCLEKAAVPEGALPWAEGNGDAGQSGLQCQHFAVVWIVWVSVAGDIAGLSTRRACSLWGVGQHAV